ncbi:peptidase family M28-domain-containing protein [Podospora fimiseda]|uniref:Peptide hydrolase n=1 Tax=Podospora fimiseda TaxID=252190 RepID=A0AAN7BYM9_9PEZI|nr:peptidase family M28-domain-containing protein [Podospora fimiseda]
MMKPLTLLFLLKASCVSVSAYTPLSNSTLTNSISPLDSFISPLDSSSLLSKILIPRVPGTPGHAAVQSHFLDFVKTQLHPDWVVEWHNSTSVTPATGDKLVPFSNIILRRDPPWVSEGRGDTGRLTLAAHYDSLYKPEGFLGAVDSAVPCAMLMEVLRGVDKGLTRKWEGEGEGKDGLEEEKGVMVLLLDGEEAWVNWGEEDSLYGSRALAETWENTKYENGEHFDGPLQAISLFVLLDLLGAAEPTVPSYFENTHWAYENMARIEGRMRGLGALETKPKRSFLYEAGKKDWFQKGYIQDDHVPFMRRGVDILHIIPTPFPAVWHTMDDDGAHLDVPTIRDWTKIFTAFVAEWMDLEGHMPERKGEARDESTESRYPEKDEL